MDRRHDTDSEIPRTPAEIRDMNRDIARKMDAIFTPRGVSVVPSIGVSRQIYLSTSSLTKISRKNHRTMTSGVRICLIFS